MLNSKQQLKDLAKKSLIESFQEVQLLWSSTRARLKTLIAGMLRSPDFLSFYWNILAIAGCCCYRGGTTSKSNSYNHSFSGVVVRHGASISIQSVRTHCHAVWQLQQKKYLHQPWPSQLAFAFTATLIIYQLHQSPRRPQNHWPSIVVLFDGLRACRRLEALHNTHQYTLCTLLPCSGH